jgi:hypothetical protein
MRDDAVIHILLSNDYEVFLGGNRLAETEVLCAPTDRLLDTLDRAGAPMTFFCDVACLWRYREAGQHAFVAAVEHQLMDMVRRGHDVQAHLHPHWLTTEIHPREGGGTSYQTDLARFALAGSASAQGLSVVAHAADLGRRARDYLEGLLRPIDPDYRCLSYRAGGYGIQPASRDIIAGLRQAGYLIDSSIVPGMRLRTNVNQIDFTDLPSSANYWVEEVGPATAAPGNGLFEIPVAAARVGVGALARTTLRRHLRRGAEGSVAGWGIQEGNEPSGARRLVGKLAVVAGRVLRGWDILELGGDAGHLLRITDRFVRNHRGETPLTFSFSCHSKTIDGIKLAALDAYLAGLRRTYGDRVVLTTFRNMPGVLGLAPAEDAAP